MMVKQIFLANKYILSPILATILANTLILLPVHPYFQLAGVLLLFFFLLGWAMLEGFDTAPEQLVERILLAIGLSIAISIFATLFLIYLPGSISKFKLLLFANVFIAFCVVITLKKGHHHKLKLPERSELTIIIVLLTIAFIVRFPKYDYREFHEDETEVLQFSTRIIGGEESALFLHRKGPVQSLIPILTMLNIDYVDEASVRFPFLLFSILSILTVYISGKLLFDDRLGAMLAGMLLAVNGFSVAFSRMVQYQSVIFFLAPLIVWLLWYAYIKRKYVLLLPGSLLVSASILAHFDSLLYIPGIIYLMWLMVSKVCNKKVVGIVIIFWGIVAILVMSFYVPYIHDPQFSRTFSYLADERIGNGYLYNNLTLLQNIDTVYQSKFYLPVLFVFTIFFALKNIKYEKSKIIFFILLGLTMSTYYFPKFWKVGDWNSAVLPWLLLVGWGIFSLRENASVIWVLWLTSFIGYVFMVIKPQTHFYVFYSMWVIVAGIGVAGIWHWLETKRSWLSILAILMAVSLFSTLFYYQTVLFWHTYADYHTAYIEHWEEEQLLHHLYGKLPIPTTYNYFGAPWKTGWKVIGALLEQGKLQGDYRAIGDDNKVSTWYTYSKAESCYDDPMLYFVVNNDETILPNNIDQYAHIGNVMVEDEPRILIYSREPQNSLQDVESDTFSYEKYAPVFDSQARITNFVNFPRSEYAENWKFGDETLLISHKIKRNTLSAGDTLELTLQWQSLKTTKIWYQVFVHIEDEKLWAQQDEDLACHFPTFFWRKGQTTQGQFRVPIPNNIPAGEYPVMIGVYDRLTMQRLPISSDDNVVVGDSLQLATITIQ